MTAATDIASRTKDATSQAAGAAGEKPKDTPAAGRPPSSSSSAPPPKQTAASDPPSQQPPAPAGEADKDTIGGSRKNRGDPQKSDSAPQDAGKSMLQNPMAGLGGTQASQPPGEKKKEGSLRIHIDLDIHVEVHLEARVKGEITIGLL